MWYLKYTSVIFDKISNGGFKGEGGFEISDMWTTSVANPHLWCSDYNCEKLVLFRH